MIFSQHSYRLHKFLLLLILAGMLLLIYQPIPSGHTLCLFKEISGIPCPACGTGHGTLALMQGHFSTAWQLNPLSYVVIAVLMILLPLVLTDVLMRRNQLYQLLDYIQLKLHSKSPLTWMLITLVLINWLRLIQHG